jgi:hypothetical protein
MQTKKGPLMCANIINDPAGAGEKAKETPPPLQRSPH